MRFTAAISSLKRLFPTECGVLRLSSQRNVVSRTKCTMDLCFGDHQLKGNSMKVRVLVVDDEVDFTKVLQERLESRGFDVFKTYSGDEALQSLDGTNPDVVILDVVLPGKDGLTTLNKIKQRRPLTGVIMLTGHTDLENAVEGMKLGAYDFLIKPTEMRSLAEKINKAYRRKVEQEEHIRNAGIEQIMGPIGVLAVGVAYEINNPVGIMVEEAGWIDDLLRAYPRTPAA